MNENRLIEIESRIAHQDHLLTELNEVMSDQQQQISSLELRCQMLLDRIRSISAAEGGHGDHDEPPPHY